MKQNLIRTSIALSLIATLSACSSESSDTAPAVGAALPAPVATDTETIDPGSAITPAPAVLATDTNTLSVSEEFSFDTARTIDIDFDLEQARGQDASVSICTSYGQDGDAFDVDYSSCAVRGPMLDGVFNHSMEITNEFDSVIAVVWFQESSIEPLHRVFTIDQPVAMAGSRGIRAASDQSRIIVWK